MSLPPARTRLLKLYEASTQIFATTYNPTGLRTGNKILRQRLKGPDLLDYYPQRTVTIRDMRQLFGKQLPEGLKRRDGKKWFFPDEEETIRMLSVERTKARGKGAPKKRGKGEKKGRR